ncbi:MAG: anhydro-N-acetylmuramic acid kinase [Burkholderiales bacterium]|nr:anhydro-N-acetylmuramic acid kinase [Burkholderiales bacterium]
MTGAARTGARNASLFVGLMSGTSLDGVDAVLAEIDAHGTRVRAHARLAFPDALRTELLALCAPDGNEIDRAGDAGNRLARLYAEAARATLVSAAVEARAVRAIGCHGQTVRHRPERGYTVQIGNPALLAELTGIAVVADFRSRDIAAGGQGAPLVPAFHASVFGSTDEERAVLNLGGIANATLLARDGSVRGFDTGPGNCLLDLWIQHTLGQRFDAGGAWARGAQPDAQLLERLLDDPFFAQLPPKSSGRELFNHAWLERRLAGSVPPQVVQATLLELTALSASRAILAHAPSTERVIVCGGGARNEALRDRLSALLAPRPVEASDARGLGAEQVEAAAFAWLAYCALTGKPAGLPSVTGAKAPRVLGAIYPA